ncbi:Cas9 inhibitor AcrIIA9 family protein [Heliophilum fasciatum]|uniref:PcfK-like protein n=1 Tax=Heliophilum fasciatum TaxID=35700 RepID=A0A4R2RNJ6_9FIRM|nr:Cas9 inhibitor AcrIIA9 family protein [Heliophilum fasciatum]MCW2277752.1 hypothetical protein [Heliophilum fasciatum]TCP64753.1 PcfK-like protein [Heliophilum fasciatum]
MLHDAIKKIQSEMQKNSNHPYVQVIGTFLHQYLETNPAAAERIMAADKTIIKSLDAMRKEAEKKKVGSCAVLTDAEGFGIVLSYFGIDGVVPTATPISQPVPAPQPQPMPKAKPAAVDFDVNLDDLLR